MPFVHWSMIVASNLIQDYTAKLVDGYQAVILINALLFRPLQLKRTLGALDIVPNGVLLLELKNQSISFANKEMYNLLNSETMESFFNMARSQSKFLSKDSESKENQSSLIEDLRKFRRHSKDDDQNSRTYKSISSDSQSSAVVDLWEYLMNIAYNLQCPAAPVVFKSKNPKKYIQVKT
jgi:hypothetical protein